MLHTFISRWYCISHTIWIVKAINILKLLFEWLILYLLYYLDVKGFASGDPENDAYAIRKFVQDGHQIMLSQSFAKVGAFPKRFVINSE